MKPLGPFAPRDSETPLSEGHIPGLRGAPVRTPLQPNTLNRTTPALMGALIKAMAARQFWVEIYGLPGYAMTLGQAKDTVFTISPRDFRPVSADGPKPLSGTKMTLAGLSLEADSLNAIWLLPTPSRAFAEELHSFNWLPAMMAQNERAARDALALVLGWYGAFKEWSPFSWGADMLTRRVYNMACAARRLSQIAPEAGQRILTETLIRQARQLLRPPVTRRGRAERLTAAAIAGCALSGKVGQSIRAKALGRLPSALEMTVKEDGSHASRAPEQALELLLDLLTLDDALSQISEQTPPAVAQAISRLTIALRSYTLPDGLLAILQGGGASTKARVAAARAHDDTPTAPPASLVGGVVRVSSNQLTVTLDVEAPASGSWSTTACGQPAALEVCGGKDRLFTSAGWTPRAMERQALRMTAGATTMSLGEKPLAEPLSGWKADLLGPRLISDPIHVVRDHQQTEDAVWLEVEHDGWMGLYGLLHQRRIYMDQKHDELRAEERLHPPANRAAIDRIAAPYALRFQLDAGVQASLARDRRSILLRGPSGKGWWFRSDGPDVAIEPAAHLDGTLTRRSQQIVVRGSARTDAETKIRWKLWPAEEE